MQILTIYKFSCLLEGLSYSLQQMKNVGSKYVTGTEIMQDIQTFFEGENKKGKE